MKNKNIPQTNIADSGEHEWNYNALIKQKLVEWRDAFEAANCGAKLNYSEIARKMEEDFHISTSPQKISAMFDIQSTREVKLQELAALCQIFNIPIQDICEYPNAATSDLELSRLLSRKNSKRSIIRQLNNPFYEGRYYCYYFRPKHFQDKLKPVEESDIEEAILEISIENGQTTVTFKEMKSSKTFWRDQTLPSFTLSGKLYHFDNTDMAYSFITDPTGRRAMALMFTFLNISADIRYYMTVAMMTFSANQTHVPLFQKMAAFRVRQDIRDNSEVTDVIRGILALNTCPIILDEETLTQLTAEDGDINKLVTPSKALKRCYMFSEAAIRSDSFFIQDEDVKMQKMLKLRKNSLFPAHEIVSEPDYFADFIKHYQQGQMTDETEKCRNTKK